MYIRPVNWYPFTGQAFLKQLVKISLTDTTPIIIAWFTSAAYFISAFGWISAPPFVVEYTTLQWRHNGCNGVSNHSRLFTLPFGQAQIKFTLKLRITGLCAGNSPVTGEFPAQMASNAENVSIWWRHHERCNLVMTSDWGEALMIIAE